MSKKLSVTVEIYRTADCTNPPETFVGRLLGYINESDIEMLLSSEKLRNKIFSYESATLKDIHKTGDAILDNYLLFVIKKVNGKIIPQKMFYITPKIVEKLAYTEKQSSGIEFLSLETDDRIWISIVEEELHNA